MSFLLPPLPPNFDAALRDVRAKRLESRVAAATRLGKPEQGDDHTAALGGLLQLASDAHPHVRGAALRALAELNDPRANPALRERLSDDDALVRELALLALAGHNDDSARSTLRAASRSPHPELRFQAIAALTQEPEARDLPLAIELLSDPDAKVRASAARGLCSFGPGAREALRVALQDAAAAVRSEAAISLARLGDWSEADALAGALQDPELVFDALDAIADFRIAQLREATAAIALSALRPLIWKAAAARALIRLEDPRGVAVLLRVLRAFRSGARSYAVRVVGELGVDELTGELVRLTRRLRGADPEALVEALTQLLPRNPQARAGLENLANRGDRAGTEARRVLDFPQG